MVRQQFVKVIVIVKQSPKNSSLSLSTPVRGGNFGHSLARLLQNLQRRLQRGAQSVQHCVAAVRTRQKLQLLAQPRYLDQVFPPALIKLSLLNASPASWHDVIRGRVRQRSAKLNRTRVDRLAGVRRLQPVGERRICTFRRPIYSPSMKTQRFLVFIFPSILKEKVHKSCARQPSNYSGLVRIVSQRTSDFCTVN